MNVLLEKIKAFHLSVDHDWLVGIGANCFFGFIGSFFAGAYILLWIFIPDYKNDPEDFEEVTA